MLIDTITDSEDFFIAPNNEIASVFAILWPVTKRIGPYSHGLRRIQ